MTEKEYNTLTKILLDYLQKYKNIDNTELSSVLNNLSIELTENMEITYD